MDRISQLPQPILHNILCHLSPKHAIRTSTLSKSWRYVGSTRPKVELRQSFFEAGQENLFSVLEKTLQMYHDLNLSIQDFILDVSFNMNSNIVSLLEKWIPIVVINMRVKALNLKFCMNYFHLPSIVLQAESLEGLYLEECRLSRINHTDKVLLSRLRTLSLVKVLVSDETLERIISNCPLIKSIIITSCDNSFHFSNYLSSFAHLKSLRLRYVRLSENSFQILSDDLCCLEDLTLSFCQGLKEFKLESRSIKNLSLGLNMLLMADIDVPNILCFKLSCSCYLPSISFTTTSSAWKSKVTILSCAFQNCHGSSMLSKIYELHKAALSRSEFSLHIRYPLEFLPGYDGCSYPPVVIENLSIGGKYSSFALGNFLSSLFCFFHPRNIVHAWYATTEDESKREANQVAECLHGILVKEMQQDLEVRMESSSNENGEELEECGLWDKDDQKIRLRLKWKELSSLA